VTEASGEAAEFLRAMGVYKHVCYQVCGRKRSFLFNPETDLLEVSTELNRIGWPPGLTLDEVLYRTEKSSSLSVIKRLALQLPHFENSFPWSVLSMEGMTSLQELYVWGFIVAAERERPFDIRLEFVDLEGDRDELCPAFPSPEGFRLYGIPAMLAVCEFVVKPDEQQHLFDLWMLIGRGLRSSPCFPDRVTLNLRYV
jgi:hypothetical protein